MSIKIIYNMQYDPICIVTAACHPTAIASSFPGRAD